jgi:hypothetical protein
MRLIADSCPSGPCPRIYDMENGDVAVQGYTDVAMTTPSGESVVRISARLLLEAADALRAETTA